MSLFVISKLAVRLQARSVTLLFSWLGQKFFFFFFFSSLFTLFGLGCQFFFQLIVRSSFCLYIKNTKCSQLLYPPGLESLVKEYNNECTLKSSDDASALRWTYRCLRYQR